MRKTAITTLTQKGQTTIPKNIREYLGIKAHDRIEFIIYNGTVSLRSAGSLEANLGRVKPRNKPEDFQKTRSEFEETVARQQVKKASK